MNPNRTGARIGLRGLVLGLGLGLAASVGLAAPAHATSVTLNDCDAFGCEGSAIGLRVDDHGDGSYTALLSIDTTGYTGSRELITSASFKAIEGFSAISLVSAPGGTWSGALERNINNADCSGRGNDFVCTQGSVEIGTATASGIWEFRVIGGSVKRDDWHIGFKYGTGNGRIISASAGPGPAIPEPSAVAAFALGGLVVAVGARRLRRR